MKHLFLLTLLSATLSSFSQSSPGDIAYFFRELKDKISYFKYSLETQNQYSSDLISAGLSDEELKIDRELIISDLNDLQDEPLSDITDFYNSNVDFINKIVKDLPYVPPSYLEAYHLHLEANDYARWIEDSFILEGTTFINLLEENYGKKDLRELKDENGKSIYESLIDYEFLEDSAFNKFLDSLERIDPFYDYEDGFGTLYKNQHSFMKKNKIDRIEGYYRSESTQPFIARSAKTGKVGFYEADYNFNPKYIQTIFPCEYDSIVYDRAADNWSLCLWTTVIAYKNGIPVIKEKQFEFPGDCEQGYQIKTYVPNNKTVMMPPVISLTYGALVAKDTEGNFYYLDADADTAMSPKYTDKNFLPLMLSGKINTDCRVKLPDGKIKYGSVWGYENDPYQYMLCYQSGSQHLSWYVDSTTYRTFYEDGSLNRIDHFKGHYNNQNFTYFEVFYPSGELLSYADSTVYRTFYKNGQIEKEFHLLEKLKFGSFTTYYPNGNIHEKGSYDTIKYFSYGQDNRIEVIHGAYTSYYANGIKKSEGSYKKGRANNDWINYTPFGSVDRFGSTEIKFPARYIDTNYRVRITKSQFDHLALVEGFIPNHSRGYGWNGEGLVHCELWDTKNNRQLESVIPMLISPTGFYTTDLVFGSSMEGDFFDSHQLNVKHTQLLSSLPYLSGYAPYINPIPIGDSLAVTNNQNSIWIYNRYDGTPLKELILEEHLTPEYGIIDYDFIAEKKNIIVLLDQVIRTYDLQLKLIKEQPLPPLKNTEERITRRMIRKGVIVSYISQFSDDEISSLELTNPYDLSHPITIHLPTGMAEFYTGELDPFRKRILFKDQQNPQLIHELIFDLKKKSFKWQSHPASFYTEQIFDFNKNIPKRRLNPTLVELNASDLTYLGVDSSLWNINLAYGQVTRGSVHPTAKLDTFYYDTYDQQELEYLKSIQMDDEVDFDENSTQSIPKDNNSPEGKEIFILGSYTQRLLFQNKDREVPIEQYVFFDINEAGDYLFSTPDQYYMGSKDLKDLVFFKHGDEYFEFEQFDLKYNRPDIVLERLGYADTSLISAYHQAYLKRLKKMGFTEEMLKDDFHLPNLKIKNFEQIRTLINKGEIELNLHLEDSKYPLDRINVWVNDVAVFGTTGISLRSLQSQSLDKTVKIPLAKGDNKVQLSVLNQVGAESFKETFNISSSAGKAKPDLYLITIGVSEFEQQDYNLTYAAKDAQDIAQLFKKSKVYGQVKSQTLLNEAVTRDNIKALESFLSKADINDHVLIFFAGHGVLSSHLDYYLATSDLDFDHPEKKGLLYDDLENLLDGIHPLNKTLIIDACHSGEIDKEEMELAAAQNTNSGEVQFRAVGHTVSSKLGSQNTLELTKSLFTDLRRGTGATVISSAGGMEFAMESEAWKNGLFTYTVLYGIQSGKADLDQNGEIWLSELQRFVSAEVTQLSKGKQQPTSRIENLTTDFRIW